LLVNRFHCAHLPAIRKIAILPTLSSFVAR